MPPIGQVHVDSALTNLSIQYKNQAYRADEIWPPLPVAKRSDVYFQYDPAMLVTGSTLDANNLPDSAREPGDEATEVNYKLSTLPFYCREYAKKQLVTDAEMAYADNPLQPAVDATINVTNTLALDNERVIANRICTRGNYNSANKVALTTGGTGTSWKQTASVNSDPFLNFTAARLAILTSSFQEPNALQISLNSSQYLSQHPKYIDRYKYTTGEGLVAGRLLHPIINGLDVIETGAQAATSKPGQTLVTGSVWVADDSTDEAVVFYRSSDMGPRSIHFGRTFEAPDDTTGSRGFSVRRYRWEPKKGEYVECSTLRDWRPIAVDASSKYLAGYLISGVSA